MPLLFQEQQAVVEVKYPVKIIMVRDWFYSFIWSDKIVNPQNTYKLDLDPCPWISWLNSLKLHLKADYTCDNFLKYFCLCITFSDLISSKTIYFASSQSWASVSDPWEMYKKGNPDENHLLEVMGVHNGKGNSHSFQFWHPFSRGKCLEHYIPKKWVE